MKKTLKNIKSLELEGIYFHNSFNRYLFKKTNWEVGKFACSPWYNLLMQPYNAKGTSIKRCDHISMDFDIREYPNGQWYADYDIQKVYSVDKKSENYEYNPYRGSYELSSTEIEYLKELKQKELAK